MFVYHLMDDDPHGFDPADYVMPQDIARYFTHPGWHILVDDVRERHVFGAAGAHHSLDR